MVEMTLEQVTSLLGWCAVINSAMLALFTLVMILGRRWIPRIHARLFDLSETQVRSEHFGFLGTYKVIITALNIVPYIALKIMLAAGS